MIEQMEREVAAEAEAVAQGGRATSSIDTGHSSSCAVLAAPAGTTRESACSRPAAEQSPLKELEEMEREREMWEAKTARLIEATPSRPQSAAASRPPSAPVAASAAEAQP